MSDDIPGQDSHVGSLKAALRDLQDFEQRYRSDAQLADVVELVRKARAKLSERIRKATLRLV